MTINQVTDTKKIQEAGSPGGGRGGPTTLETHEVAYICTYGRIAWLGTCSKGPGTPEAVLQCCLGLPRKSTSSRPTLSNISRSLFDALFFLSYSKERESAWAEVIFPTLICLWRRLPTSRPGVDGVEFAPDLPQRPHCVCALRIGWRGKVLVFTFMLPARPFFSVDHKHNGLMVTWHETAES